MSLVDRTFRSLLTPHLANTSYQIVIEGARATGRNCHLTGSSWATEEVIYPSTEN